MATKLSIVQCTCTSATLGLYSLYRFGSKEVLSDMSWHGLTDFKQECVTNWTKLFATNEVQFTDNAIDNFLAFVDHMSCSAETYVSLSGSNGCADQLTNWDGTQKMGLGAPKKRRGHGLSL